MPAAVFFTILDRVDSTNNYAMQQVHAGLATHGMAWLALEQTAGKGQRGKSWDAEPGKNIALSMVLQPGKPITSQPFYLSAAVALACYQFFSRYAGDETKIKWPNDLYWRDRKAGGVLIETIYHGREWKWAIIGIGININQVNFDTGLKNPVSLKQITGKDHDVVELAKELQILVLKHVDKLSKMDRDQLLKDYNHHLYKKNEVVRLRKDNMNFETMIKEVSQQGKLVTIDAFERYFDFGEVEWIL
jgi:BirA family biotin operon repressor/biotin-[acetyl-CoA-carboxylase] ligase